MREYSELKAIFMNDDLIAHLAQAGHWLEYGAVAVAVPVTITTAHATFMNYWRASEHNATLGRNETWEDSVNNLFQSMVMTATGKSRLMVTAGESSTGDAVGA